MSPGRPPPSWMPGVSFCGVGGVVWWLDGLLPCCVVFMLAGSFLGELVVEAKVWGTSVRVVMV